ncbi:hypothetical protein BV25DRAFT_1820028 [Artomyces pyxidatus]|uniref:Uncharacterized protein n=1 Tax=Artomyces pyxidatus TaxID=48021 RepID=A0ACB8TER1_9AGAM|nr:hypothetical protein BV25DRAFT_1820028 [Artomyces pyxidatus]
MHQYGLDLDVAPMDFMIVDKQHPRGLLPGTNFDNLSDMYKPSAVASVLLEAGYDGVIESPDTMHRTGTGKIEQPAYVLPAVQDTSMPWPTYRRRLEAEIIYPVVLQARTPVPFTLSLPGPTIQHSVNVLKAYGKIGRYIPEAIGLIYVWMRSWGVQDLNPFVVSALFIKSLQETYVTASSGATLPDESVVETTVWMPFQDKGRSNYIEAVELDISYVSNPDEMPAKSHASVLLQFFKWYSGKAFHKDAPNGHTPIVRIHEPNIIDKKYGDRLRSFSEASRPWTRHQLIVPDLFVPTHNHGFNVNRSTLLYVHRLSEVSANLLSTCYPLYSIFGPYWTPTLHPDALMVLSDERRRSPSPYPRPPAGLAQRRMYSTNARLGEEVQRKYHLNVPPPTIQHLRATTLARVSAAIQRQYGMRYRVEIFGSTQYGVDSARSDLDLVVIDPERLDGFHPRVDLKRLPRLYDVYDLATTLRRAGFRTLRTIASASVPIVKFMDPTTGLSCDINVNDQLGLMNTALIKHYCDILPILRPLIMTIKQWAKPLGYNSPSPPAGEPTSFSSYALVLMTIGLLQTRSLLPNLQHPNGAAPTSDAVFWLRSRVGNKRSPVDVSWTKVRDWRPPYELNVEQALMDWFHYWGHEHTYSDSLMSIRDGGVGKRQRPLGKKKVAGFPDNVPFSGRPPLVPETATAQSKAASTIPSAVSPPAEEPEDAQRSADAVSEEGDEDAASHPDVGLSAEAEQELDKEGKPYGEPTSWQTQYVCVPDPFILTKNVTGSVNTAVAHRFRDDCRRAYAFLCMEGELSQLLRFDPPDPDRPMPPPRTPRRRPAKQTPRADGRDSSGPPRPAVASTDTRTPPRSATPSRRVRELQGGHGTRPGGQGRASALSTAAYETFKKMQETHSRLDEEKLISVVQKQTAGRLEAP